MAKGMFFVVAVVMVFSLNSSFADVSLVGNSSFEVDGAIGDITVDAPTDWNDVNLPDGNFKGYVDTSWQSDANYCLVVSSERRGAFEANEMATVSQQVYLGDVSEITFDLKLGTTSSQVPWDANRFSAVILIDGNEVWDSNELTPVGNGEYVGVILVDVDDFYKDTSSHTLSLGMKAHVRPSDPQPYYTYYISRWDNFKFDSHCHGAGYLREDLNMDCEIGWGDVKVMTEKWLNLSSDFTGVSDEQKVFERCDLYEDSNDTIDFLDYAVLANSWTASSVGEEIALPTTDLDENGIVNFVDFAILSSGFEGKADQQHYHAHNRHEFHDRKTCSFSSLFASNLHLYPFFLNFHALFCFN